MTDDQLERWKDCVLDALNYLSELNMNIFPVYLESDLIYSYTVTGGNIPFEVYDMPLHGILCAEEDCEAVYGYIKKFSNNKNYNMVLRNVSPNTDEESLSIIIPKNVCATRCIGDKNVIMMDNNIEHLSNSHVIDILDWVLEVLSDEYDKISEDEDD